MKLRNKKTGEIKAFDEVMREAYKWNNYNSLAELNEEWEDYGELESYWYINEFGTPTEVTHTRENIYDTQRKNFGNYFETKEEAKGTVEKLEAWKRLKDEGITFRLNIDESKPFVQIYSKEENGPFLKVLRITEDLTLLFGGEE